MSSTTSTPEISENVKIELARRAAIKEEMYPKQVNGKAKRRRVRNSGPVRDARAAAAVPAEVAEGAEQDRTEYKVSGDWWP